MNKTVIISGIFSVAICSGIIAYTTYTLGKDIPYVRYSDELVDTSDYKKFIEDKTSKKDAITYDTANSKASGVFSNELEELRRKEEILEDLESNELNVENKNEPKIDKDTEEETNIITDDNSDNSNNNEINENNNSDEYIELDFDEFIKI